MFLNRGVLKCVSTVLCLRTFYSFSESPAVRFNESKTLEWLERKARSLASALKERKIDIHGSRSASLVVTQKDIERKSEAKAETEDEISADLLRYAAEVVGDYLSFDLKTRLMKRLKLADETTPSSSADAAPPSSKKRKLSGKEGAEEPSEDYSKSSTPFSPAGNKKPATKAAKDLAKASKGTASVMSFFKATPKK